MNFYDEIRKRYGNVKRARGFYIYTEKNVRLLDLYLDGGMSILGRKENQTPLVFKQNIDRGLTAFLPSFADFHLKKALNSLFPNHSNVYLLLDWSKALPFFSIENVNDELDKECLLAENMWKPFFPLAEKLSENECFFVQVPFCTTVKILVSKNEIPIVSCDISAAEKEVIARAFFDLIRIIDLNKKNDCLSENEIINSARGKKAKLQAAKDIKAYNNIKELCSNFWKIEGVYLFPKMSKENYEAFFKLALDAHIFLSPYFNIPSILPKIRIYTEFENFLKSQIKNII